MQDGRMVQTLEGAWKEFAAIDLIDDSQELYEAAQKLLAGVALDSKTISTFSKTLGTQKLSSGISQKMGLFLSAAINNSPDKKCTIECNPKYTISHLCYKNEKDVVITGNAGNMLGAFMKSGSVMVDGQAGDSVGTLMEGGTITIKGTAKSISDTAQGKILVKK